MERQAALWRDAAGPEAPGVTCLRLGNVAGTDMLGRSVASRNPLVLDRFADGHGPRRSYIGIGGLARVLGTLMARAMAGEALPFVLNVAAPRPVAMSDLLTAWGRAWTWRPAPPAALQTVTMDTGRLAALHVFTEADSDPAAMAAEWTEATL